MGTDIIQFVNISIAGLTDPAPWQWVSFADPNLPAGTQFLGVAIVRAHNVGHAAMICHERGINPGGEVMAFPIPEDLGDPPAEWDHKLVRDKADVERMTQEWHRCGCKTLAEFEEEESAGGH